MTDYETGFDLGLMGRPLPSAYSGDLRDGFEKGQRKRIEIIAETMEEQGTPIGETTALIASVDLKRKMERDAFDEFDRTAADIRARGLAAFAHIHPVPVTTEPVVESNSETDRAVFVIRKDAR